MKRPISLVVFALVLNAGSAHAFDPYDPAVKKLMPKDQLEIFEKAESLGEQFWNMASKIKDAKKREEENERLAGEGRQLQETIVKKLQTTGLKDWVGTGSIIMPGFRVVFDSWQPIRVNLEMRDKPKGEIEKAVSAIKVNDIVRFSTKPDPKYAMPKQVHKTFGGFDQLIKIDSITAMEKIGTKPPPGKK
jgi:hypothetical protein